MPCFQNVCTLPQWLVYKQFCLRHDLPNCVWNRCNLRNKQPLAVLQHIRGPSYLSVVMFRKKMRYNPWNMHTGHVYVFVVFSTDQFYQCSTGKLHRHLHCDNHVRANEATMSDLCVKNENRKWHNQNKTQQNCVHNLCGILCTLWIWLWYHLDILICQ